MARASAGKRWTECFRADRWRRLRPLRLLRCTSENPSWKLVFLRLRFRFVCSQLHWTSLVLLKVSNFEYAGDRFLTFLGRSNRRYTGTTPRFIKKLCKHSDLTAPIRRLGDPQERAISGTLPCCFAKVQVPSIILSSQVRPVLLAVETRSPIQARNLRNGC